MNQGVKIIQSRHIQDFVKLVIEFRSRENKKIGQLLKNYESGINKLKMAKQMLDDRIKEIAQQREKIKDKTEEIETKEADINNLKAELEEKHKEQGEEREKMKSLNTL